MTDQNPLAGLTGDQADDAIAALEAKIDQLEETVKAAKAELKARKAARKQLVDPEPPGNGVVATAQTAEVGVEAPEVGS